MDLDGIDGLIHISELSWGHVNHPSEVLSIGHEVSVKVLDIDRDRQRISLGLKQTQEDPWERVVNTYNVGDVLEGKVTKVVSFGAFVEIMEGVEGLVHISELAQHHVENPREIVDPGDEVKVKILEIDDERRRLSLSLKRVEGQVLPRARAGAGRAGGDERAGRRRRGARPRPLRGGLHARGEARRRRPHEAAPRPTPEPQPPAEPEAAVRAEAAAEPRAAPSRSAGRARRRGRGSRPRRPKQPPPSEPSRSPTSRPDAGCCSSA